MKAKKQILWLGAAMVLGAMGGCDKSDSSTQGSWSIRYVNNFLAGSEGIDSFCQKGKPTVLSLSGSVDRYFDGNKYIPDQLSVALNYGQPQLNTAGSNQQYFRCGDVSLKIYQHKDITVFPPDYPFTWAEDASGRCILTATEVRTRPNITIEVSLKGSGSKENSDGSISYDDSNRKAGVTYDCDSGTTKAIW